MMQNSVQYNVYRNSAYRIIVTYTNRFILNLYTFPHAIEYSLVNPSGYSLMRIGFLNILQGNGVDAGADDYVVKPLDADERVAGGQIIADR